ncbi:Apoptosis-inducing factor 3 [Strongyloides ratti]|uniref:Apoptosis-inducing factor 3 n=1 Tax=Strongyloides ratti TaxID=34506 RepID=A0A090LIV1_STRRB|nr:Apoptosis-inducing factor 3 [Strongyloides ratti]CEF69717.1 Apoptosis-inducing factor 3 [Strongyloides ratti]
MYRQLIVNDDSINNEIKKIINKDKHSLNDIKDNIIKDDKNENEKDNKKVDVLDNSKFVNLDVNDDDNETQFIFILKEQEINNGRMRQINIKNASNCANCNSPLIEGVLSKNRIYCVPYGTCYDIRTGYLEEYPGLYSQNTFKTIVKNGKIFIETKFYMLSVNKKERPMYKYIFKMSNENTIIIGSGIAAVTCAEVLRQNGYKDSIILLTKDNTLPFARFLLSTNPNISDDEILLREKTFYNDYGIDIRLNTKVIKVDVTSKIVYCDNEKSFEYSNLVIATGTALKKIVIPGSLLENVLYFKNPDDAKLIYDSSKNKHVSILNCTPNIITLSTILKKYAKSITIYNKENILFKEGGKSFNEELIKYLENVCHINVRLNDSIRIIEGETKVKHLVLSSGNCAVSNIVIPYNGEIACSSFMLGAKLKTTSDSYIEVNENMKTNIPNVYAIGDCSFSDKYKSNSFRNSWQLAQIEGKICAMNILNKEMINFNKEVQLFWFNIENKMVVFVHKIFINDNEPLSRGSFETNDFITYFFDKNFLIGVICFGDVTPAIQIFACFKKNICITKEEVQIMKKNNWSYKLI